MARRRSRELVNAVHDRRRAKLVLHERAADGGVETREVPAEYSFFLSADAPRDVVSQLCDDSRVRAVRDEGDWLRVCWRDPYLARKGAAWVESKGVPTHEAGVSPIRRYLLDSGRRVARPRVAYLDFETDSRVSFSEKEKARVLCWALVGEDGKERTGCLEEDDDVDEARLMCELVVALQGYDLILAWNGDRFDFPVFEARVGRHLPGIDVRRWLKLDHMRLFKRHNMMAAQSGEEKQSFALESIAQAVLGYGKHDFDSSRTWEAWAEGGERRRELVAYCLQDTRLMPAIEQKTGYVSLHFSLCEACNVLPDSTGALPNVFVEGFLLSICKDRGFKFPSRLSRGSSAGKYKGAFVMDPTERGILKNVHVADFASLYPSIILTWNMSPETRRERLPDGSRPDGCCEAPLPDGTFGECFDVSRVGILPFAVAELIRMRKEWSDRQAALPPGTPEWHEAKRRSTAYKIAANSFYGVVGSPSSVYFDRRVAEAVTQAGAWLIVHTMREGEKRGMRSIYGDTDSAFIAGCTKRKFEEFVRECNELIYPNELASQGVDLARSRIKLAYEKEFERLIFPIGKSGQSSAKRYCGRYAHYKGTAAKPGDPEAVEVKGLEYKRGDSAKLERDMQFEVVGELMAGCEDPEQLEQLILDWREKVLRGDLLLEQVVISKALQKRLKDYVRKTKKDGTAGALPPHVEIAQRMAEQGRDVSEGTRVRYVVVDGSTSPKKVAQVPARHEDWDGKVDRYELWDRVVYPATQRLLSGAFPEHDWSRHAKSRPRRGVSDRQLELLS